ncbi:RES family NAD+ phosphorylase [Georgenia sunbinii]|uniref:RES family NAD+ phosphorylase n=1 Tax=Georgenia sunbinii TaxID=3117728 RepID=UPI002F26911C
MHDPEQPLAHRTGAVFSRVAGEFFRAVDPAFRDAALMGSRGAGRYSPPGAPTLYLSSSPDGVAAAMLAHHDARSLDLEVVSFDVRAERILDLRDPDAAFRAGVDPADAAAPWQEVVARGGRPRSWQVRERLLSLGADGLIDPSRKRPGLWHLTLFAWNTPGAAVVLPRPA